MTQSRAAKSLKGDTLGRPPDMAISNKEAYVYETKREAYTLRRQERVYLL